MILEYKILWYLNIKSRYIRDSMFKYNEILYSNITRFYIQISQDLHSDNTRFYNQMSQDYVFKYRKILINSHFHKKKCFACLPVRRLAKLIFVLPVEEVSSRLDKIVIFAHIRVEPSGMPLILSSKHSSESAGIKSTASDVLTWTHCSQSHAPTKEKKRKKKNKDVALVCNIAEKDIDVVDLGADALVWSH